MDKILQNRLSKMHETVLAKLLVLEAQNLITIMQGVKPWDIAAILCKEIESISQVIVEIKGVDPGKELDEF